MFYYVGSNNIHLGKHMKTLSMCETIKTPIDKRYLKLVMYPFTFLGQQCTNSWKKSSKSPTQTLHKHMPKVNDKVNVELPKT